MEFSQFRTLISRPELWHLVRHVNIRVGYEGKCEKRTSYLQEKFQVTHKKSRLRSLWESDLDQDDEVARRNHLMARSTFYRLLHEYDLPLEP